MKAEAQAIIRWNQLNGEEAAELLKRPVGRIAEKLYASTQSIVDEVREEGDEAVRRLTEKFDRVEIGDLAIDPSEIGLAMHGLPAEQVRAIDQAYEMLWRYHERTTLQPFEVETAPGISCGRVVRPVERVGLYIPGGTAPLPSTVLMLGIPAKIAQCAEVVLCTPPQSDGSIHPLILAAAHKCGIRRIFRCGGAQAIAAMAFGTQSIPKVDKIFGPGNAWVTAAKQLVSGGENGVTCDMPAGPSEVLVIADGSANGRYVSADLLAQAEHGPDSQSLLFTDSDRLAAAVVREVPKQLALLSRRSTAENAFSRPYIVHFERLEQAFEVSNLYAPEHLILSMKNAVDWLPKVQSAGSVFLGPWSPETLGDYCSGTNHVLPTYGYARSVSGLCVSDFQKSISMQNCTFNGLKSIGPTAVVLAQAEGLDAHAAAVKYRLQQQKTLVDDVSR